ncbi:hypothetical protein QVD17_16159 [Tagetes erecta]|uniref:GRF-type domain-containing protein n=1 Tax=Tagetes erecta TaxID=13708 RepID=A0AAD8NZB9_TARER|nr:hypothetical protein QVD17_16159 [Tagetes erecta]
MSSASSSTSSYKKNTKRFKVDTEGNVYCNHDLIAIQRVAGRRSVRMGQEFYGCTLWPNEDCKFFMWKEEFDDFLKKHGSCNCCATKEQELVYAQMQNLKLQDEIKNLKLQLSLKKSNWNLYEVV